jgi:serine/threonine protein kinase
VAPGSDEALTSGTRLDEFEVLRVLGIGGFGIVYLAFDHVLERQVAIKEFMPSTLAGRGRDGEVVLRSPAFGDTFDAGLLSFMKEARLLASFDHPSLVKVHRFWEARGTAYMVMPYYAGQTLNMVRANLRKPPDEAWLRRLADPLLSALKALHAQQVYHRDVSPDNILLLPDGRPVLLDFGSARHVISGRTQALTAVLKPQFAPVEQYGEMAGMRQGPWTDLYALGAVMYFSLTGRPPPPVVMRTVRDGMPLLAERDAQAFEGIGDPLLRAIDWALAVAPECRPQSVKEMREAMDGKRFPPPPTSRWKEPSHPDGAGVSAGLWWQKTQPAGRKRRAKQAVAGPAAWSLPRAVVWGVGALCTVAALTWGVSSVLGHRAPSNVPAVLGTPGPAAVAPAQLPVVKLQPPASLPLPLPLPLSSPSPSPSPAEPALAAQAVPAATPSPRAAPVVPIATPQPRVVPAASVNPAVLPSQANTPAQTASRPVRSPASPRADDVAPRVRSAAPDSTDLCEGKGLVAHAVCLHRVCAEARHAATLQCVQLRERMAQRDRESFQ